MWTLIRHEVRKESGTSGFGFFFFSLLRRFDLVLSIHIVPGVCEMDDK